MNVFQLMRAALSGTLEHDARQTVLQAGLQRFTGSALTPTPLKIADL
jgi:hypothetical protein